MTHLPVYFQAREEIHQSLDWQQPQHQQQTMACHTSVSGVRKEKQSPSTTQAKAAKGNQKSVIKDLILLPYLNISSFPHGQKREELYVRKLVATAFEIFGDMPSSEI